MFSEVMFFAKVDPKVNVRVMRQHFVSLPPSTQALSTERATASILPLTNDQSPSCQFFLQTRAGSIMAKLFREKEGAGSNSKMRFSVTNFRRLRVSRADDDATK